MTTTTSPAQSWVQGQTDVLLAAVDSLTDAELAEPSALPGWSRGHLLAHVAYNAEALRRLATWARTGVETPMYASKQQRAEEIAHGARLGATDLRALLRESAAGLSRDVAALEPAHWTRNVVTAQGRTVKATEIVWLRAREVCVHAVDLDVGISFENLPDDFCRALVTDIAALRSARGEPPVELHADDGGRWTIEGSGVPEQVHGSARGLARWLSGRGAAGVRADSGGDVSPLPPWI